MIMLLLLVGTGLMAQRGVIKGVVVNAKTGAPIEFASLQLEGTPLGATTDDQGYFFLVNVEAGHYVLLVSSIGFKNQSEPITLKDGDTKVIRFSLEQVAYDLDEVAVSAERNKLKRQIRISEIELLPAHITRLPSVGSMPDITQQIQTLPGVITTGDAGSQIYIRGGSPVQNKVIMDGAVIYNPFHSSGLHSVFDIDVLRKAEVFTGGFGAEYGGSISSVMDIATRSGDINSYHGGIDVSTIGGKLLLEGPVFRPNTDSQSNASFIAYYKTSWFDKASERYYQYVDQNLPFNFHDLYGKFTIFSGDVFKGDLFGFSFQDHTGYSGSVVNYNWKNQGFGGNITMSPAQSSILLNGYFAVSSFNSQLEELNYSPRESSVGSVNLGIRIDNYIGKHYFKYGIELLTLKTDYLYYTTGFNATNQANNTSELSAFLLFFGDFNKLLIQPGMRIVLYSSLNKISPEPRISLKYLVMDNFRIKLAAGLYTQNLIGAVSDRDIINYFRGYLSAPVNIAATREIENQDYLLQESVHLIGGFEFEIGNSLFFNIEAYFKDYPQLINYNRNKVFNEFDYPDNPDLLTKDFILETGESRGLEFTGEYRKAPLSFSLIYSLSETTRSYEDIAGQKITYAPHYDRRHNLNMVGSIDLDRSQTWMFNLRWNFGTGFPFTPTLGFYETNTLDDNELINYLTQNGTLEFFYGEYNTARLPSYHRLDVSIKKTFSFNEESKMELEINAVNVYNQKNIYYIDRATNEAVYQLPFLPGIRVAYSF
jgi:hypothetical protein